MAKNYILEPIALEFTSEDQYKVQAELAGTDLATKTISELKALIPAGTTIEFNGEKYITVGSSSSAESIEATKTGEAPSPGVIVPIIVFYGYVTIAEEPAPARITYDSGEDTTNPGTYTVSIYTEDSSSDTLTPITREEMYLSAIAGDTTLPSGMTPITRKEMFLQKILDKNKG